MGTQVAQVAVAGPVALVDHQRVAGKHDAVPGTMQSRETADVLMVQSESLVEPGRALGAIPGARSADDSELMPWLEGIEYGHTQAR